MYPVIIYAAKLDVLEPMTNWNKEPPGAVGWLSNPTDDHELVVEI